MLAASAAKAALPRAGGATGGRRQRGIEQAGSAGGGGEQLPGRGSRRHRGGGGGLALARRLELGGGAFAALAAEGGLADHGAGLDVERTAGAQGVTERASEGVVVGTEGRRGDHRDVISRIRDERGELGGGAFVVSGSGAAAGLGVLPRRGGTFPVGLGGGDRGVAGRDRLAGGGVLGLERGGQRHRRRQRRLGVAPVGGATVGQHVLERGAGAGPAIELFLDGGAASQGLGALGRRRRRHPQLVEPLGEDAAGRGQRGEQATGLARDRVIGGQRGAAGRVIGRLEQHGLAEQAAQPANLGGQGGGAAAGLGGAGALRRLDGGDGGELGLGLGPRLGRIAGRQHVGVLEEEVGVATAAGEAVAALGQRLQLAAEGLGGGAQLVGAALAGAAAQHRGLGAAGDPRAPASRR